MADDFCSHLDTIHKVTPSSKGCEECLAWAGNGFICGSAAAAAMSAAATSRAASTPPSISTTASHPIIEGYDPPEGWGWCYIDEVMFDLGGNVTPQVGPIPRYY